MIELVVAALGELGLVPAGADPLRLPVLARFAGNTTVIVFLEGGRMAVAKLGTLRGLEGEHRTLQQVHAALPRYTPAPLGLSRPEGIDILVVSGIAHEPLIGEPQGRAGQELAQHLGAFLASAQAAFALPGFDALPAAHAAVRSISDRVPDWPLLEWLDRHASILHELGGSSQHGDLSTTNIGLTADGIVVFDWEDFGQVQLAGFDLATLLLSQHRFDVANLRQALDTPSTFAARLFDAAAPALNLNRQRFFGLLPGYLACFVDLKTRQGYGEYVQNLALYALRASLD
jgi:hypothetical protein